MIQFAPSALEPLGQALLAYWQGNKSARLIQEYRSGRQMTIPASVFFRTPKDFFPTDNAIAYCQGRILVVGAGTGVHALELEQMGFEVTAIDLCIQAVRVMQERGLKDVRHRDFFHFKGEYYDTILMLGHNIGIIETLEGLPRLFRKCERLLNPNGQLLANSVSEPPNQSLLNQRDYPGELEFRLRYEHIIGSWMRWLHIDFDSLAAHTLQSGWRIQKLTDPADGTFLARLRPAQ